MNSEAAGAKLGAAAGRLVARAAGLALGAAHAAGRHVARITRPRWEYAWRWWHYGFREPLAPPAGAHEALRNLCGYRLVGGPHRVVRVMPGFRRFRFGVRVVVEAERPRSRHWTTRWERWVDDPLELWLIRSAVRGPAPPIPRAGHAPGPAGDGLPAGMTEDELDELLGRP